ncbi:MAG: patatin-like phospholipase family protein [Sulfuriferula sp.]|nr:patatin-like phospholipase family protein [Sulfuriferula sp.]
MRLSIFTKLLTLFLLLTLTACGTLPNLSESDKPIASRTAPKIALVLGGGGTRGFAHIGVIKALEAQGIVPDIIVGTSAGSVVGALYAYGYSGFELQKVAIQMEEQSVIDWAWPSRGVFKGEALQNFINTTVKNTPIEKLKRPFAAVATDLSNGEVAVFRTGNTGQAVRASSAVPGIFQPVTIAGHNYVDGGLVRPVPVSVARSLGADFVIAVDISNKPKNNTTASTIDVLMQTFDIMSQTINRYELPKADIVIRPRTQDIDVSSLDGRHIAVLEGEKATALIMPELKAKLAKLR